jgi:Ca2+-binding RTX toxin-like protein
MRFAARIRPILATIALLGTAPAAARADTILANGFFDTAPVAPWQATAGALTANGSSDAQGLDTSGAAHLRVPFSNATSSAFLRQCLAVPTGHQWFTAAKVRFEAEETAVGQVSVRNTFYSGPGCTGGLTGVVSGTTLPSVVRQVWFDLEVGDYTNGVSGGPTTQSALVTIELVKQGSGGPLSISIDDVTFAEIGVPLCRGRSATMFGTEGPDTLRGTPGDDVIVGLGGNDRIFGRGGSDWLCGDDGDDKLIGGGGKDYLEGGNGRDVLRGGPLPDLLLGGPGNDKLFGGPGDDTLGGGPDVDKCRAGADDPPSESLCDVAL